MRRRARLPSLIAAALLAACWAVVAVAEPRIVHRVIEPSDFARASEALQDAIESQGLIPGPRSQFGEMLARTAPALGNPAPVFAQAEIFSFCSAQVSWALVLENPESIAYCPLHVALYTAPGAPGRVHLVYHDPGPATAGTRRASDLLHAIAEAAASQARRFVPASAPR